MWVEQSTSNASMRGGRNRGTNNGSYLMKFSETSSKSAACPAEGSASYKGDTMS